MTLFFVKMIPALQASSNSLSESCIFEPCIYKII
jgi:hypothetical protein